MDTQFVRDRITQLRLKKGVSEYQMSYDLGHMVNQSTEKKNTRQIQMTIEGHKVTISFAQEANPTLSALVRNTLLDAYIRKNGLCSEEQPA